MNAATTKALAALREAHDVLRLSDPDGRRAELIHAPEDAEVRLICERVGYGAVMDSAARQWRLQDPVGAHTTGACVQTVRDTLTQINAAIQVLEAAR